MNDTDTMESTEPKIGAHPNVPFLEYQQWDAMNWHKLKPFDVSPKQGRFEMTLPPDSTEAMVVGGAFHTCILEPEQFASTYAVMPRFDGHHNSKVHKEAKAAWEEANAERVSLTRDELESLRGMQKAVMAHPVAKALLLAKGRNELSICWRDKESGELCKGRIDRLCRVPANVVDARADGDLICLVDLKKTSRLHQFDGEVAKYAYHGQLAMYKGGLEALEQAEITPLVIAVQDDPPHDVAVFSMGDAIEQGSKMFRRLLNTYLRAKKEDSWPGICPIGTLPVVLPAWRREPETKS